MTDRPEIQLIANLVVHDGAGRVLLADYDLPDELDSAADDSVAAEPARWWLPGHELDPYQHPDEAAAQALAAFTGITVSSSELVGVQSFRGRRGWHVSFDYRVLAAGEAWPDAAVRTRWFDRHAWPRTAHGAWERGVVDQVLGAAAERG